MQSRDPKNRWMWADALEMLDEATRLQRRFFEVSVRSTAAPRWEPPVDVFESQEEVWFFYALPGVLAGQVEVALEGTELVVRGERSLPPVAHTTTIRRLELPHGRFERRVALPNGRYDLITQQLDQGCLVIGLRRIA
jgi:HSP20 family molecular chaperone IbpA